MDEGNGQASVKLQRAAKGRRQVLVWQAAGGLGVAMLAGSGMGTKGFFSAAFGGIIGVLGSLVFAWLTSGPAPAPQTVLRVMLRAEAARLTVMVLALWLVLVAWPGVVPVALIGAFVISVVVAVLAVAVMRD